jgi:hypothetical protein
MATRRTHFSTNDSLHGRKRMGAQLARIGNPAWDQVSLFRQISSMLIVN